MELIVVRMTAFDEKDDVFLDDASKWNDNNMKEYVHLWFSIKTIFSYLGEYTSAGSKGKSLCKDLLAKHYDKIIGKADRIYNTDIQMNAATTSRAKTVSSLLFFVRETRFRNIKTLNSRYSSTVRPGISPASYSIWVTLIK